MTTRDQVRQPTGTPDCAVREAIRSEIWDAAVAAWEVLRETSDGGEDWGRVRGHLARACWHLDRAAAMLPPGRSAPSAAPPTPSSPAQAPAEAPRPRAPSGSSWPQRAIGALGRSLSVRRLGVDPSAAAFLVLLASVAATVLLVARPAGQPVAATAPQPPAAEGRPPQTAPVVPGSVPASRPVTLFRAGVGDVPAGEYAFMAVGPDGTFSLSDQRRKSILRFDQSGKLLAEWGPQLHGGATLAGPAGIASAGDGLFVLDREAVRLLRLDSQGTVEQTVDLGPLAPYGLNGMTLDPQGNLYIADTGRDRILVYSEAGVFAGEIGGSGTGLGQMKQPNSVAVGPGGSIYVAEIENLRIQRFDRNRKPVGAWKVPYQPFGIAVDAQGRVLVTDSGKRRIQVFSGDGTLLDEIGGEGEEAIGLSSLVQVELAPGGHTLYALGHEGVARIALQ